MLRGHIESIILHFLYLSTLLLMMPYPLLPIFTLLSVALVAISHAAALPPELYWMSVLPDTPMPKAITDVLFPGFLEEKDRVSMNTGEGKSGGNGRGNNMNIAIDGNRFIRYHKYDATKTEPHKEERNPESALDGNRFIHYHRYDATKTEPHKEERNPESALDGNRFIHYHRYDATKTEPHKEEQNPESALDGNRFIHYHRYDATKTEPHKEERNPESALDGNRFIHYHRYDATKTEPHKEERNPESALDGNRFLHYHRYDATKTEPHKEERNPESALDGNRFLHYHKYDATKTEPHKEEQNPESALDGNRFLHYHRYDATKTEPHKEEQNPESALDGNRFLHYHKYDATKTEPHKKERNPESALDGNKFLHYHRYHKYNATKTESKDGPSVTIFFFKEDLYPGKNMYLHFTKNANAATFLPRQVADSIPFSSNKVEDIFNELSVKPGSKEAQIIKQTIEDCEEEGIKGEEKHCATSLESMVDFSTSRLGNDVEVLSTMVGKETELQKYTITPGVKKLSMDKTVVCHKQNYPYAVFYCHKTDTPTEVYSVPLEGSDGTRVKAMAICHIDTSKWHPKHFAFQFLNVKPGTVPVCHFLHQDHVVWVPK